MYLRKPKAAQSPLSMCCIILDHFIKHIGRISCVGQVSVHRALTASNWQKLKSTYLTWPCHKIYRVEAVGLKGSNYTLKITIVLIM